MIALLAFGAAAAFAPDQKGVIRPTWRVAQFRDLRSGKYGALAATILARELERTGRYEVVPPGAGQRSLRSPNSGERMELVRAAKEAMRDDVRDGTLVVGEVVDHRVDAHGPDRLAKAALRTIAYDVASGEPISGALVVGEAVRRKGSVSDGALRVEAIQNAAADAVEAMRTAEKPVGTIVNTQSRSPLVNRGRKDDYVEGTRVVVVRGKRLVARAHVALAEDDTVELAFDPPTNDWRPGDRVRVIVALPADGPMTLGKLKASSLRPQ